MTAINRSCDIYVKECSFPELWLAQWDLREACLKLGQKHGAKGKLCYMEGYWEMQWAVGNKSIPWIERCINTVIKSLRGQTSNIERPIHLIDDAILQNFSREINGSSEAQYCVTHDCENHIRNESKTWFTGIIESRLGYLTEKTCACMNAPELFGPFTKLEAEAENANPDDQLTAGAAAQQAWTDAIFGCIPFNCTKEAGPGYMLHQFGAGVHCADTMWSGCDVETCCAEPTHFQEVALPPLSPAPAPTTESPARLYISGDYRSGHPEATFARSESVKFRKRRESEDAGVSLSYTSAISIFVVTALLTGVIAGFWRVRVRASRNREEDVERLLE
jgi:hypothetical protein